MIYHLRRQKAVALLEQQGLDALLFISSENLRYLCGFTGTDGALVITRKASVFLTDSRYTTQAREQVETDHVIEYSSQCQGVIDCLAGQGVKGIGFEADMSSGKLDDFKQKSQERFEWRLCRDDLDNIRLVKDETEIRSLEAVAALNAAAFTEVLPQIRPGVSEREIALQLEFALKLRGAEEKAFDFIVASGERGALPHGVASDKLIDTGELVTIDFGCRLNGYHSDETVTISVGEPDPEMRTVFEVVLEAHDRAMGCVKPGVPLVEIDRTARDFIKAHSYGDYFGHGLGHGVGLAVHEAPTVSPRSQLSAEAGMVITIEPGIYLPGKGGVRIEDTILVTTNGFRPLTTIPKTFYNVMIS